MTDWKTDDPALASIGNDLDKLANHMFRGRLAAIETAIWQLIEQGEKPAYSFRELNAEFYVFESGRTLKVSERMEQKNDAYEIITTVEEVAPRGQSFVVHNLVDDPPKKGAP